MGHKISLKDWDQYFQKNNNWKWSETITSNRLSIVSWDVCFSGVCWVCVEGGSMDVWASVVDVKIYFLFWVTATKFEGPVETLIPIPQKTWKIFHKSFVPNIKNTTQMSTDTGD